MAKIVKVPVLGQSVEEVRILQWFKQEGDTVAKGEPLVEIETDKVNHEVESQEEGILRRILAPVDAYVKVEAPLYVIGTADEPIEGLTGESPEVPTPSSASPERGTDADTNNRSAAGQVDEQSPLPGEAEEGVGGIKVSPRARRAADEAGIALAELAGRGTGPNGRVQEKDVLGYLSERDAAAQLTQEMAGRGVKRHRWPVPSPANPGSIWRVLQVPVAADASLPTTSAPPIQSPAERWPPRAVLPWSRVPAKRVEAGRKPSRSRVCASASPTTSPVRYAPRRMLR